MVHNFAYWLYKVKLIVWLACSGISLHVWMLVVHNFAYWLYKVKLIVWLACSEIYLHVWM